MHDRKKLTIAVVESATAMGGVQFSTLYLLQRLNTALWAPIVVCPGEGDLSAACRKAGINVRTLNLPRTWSTSLRLGRNSARFPNPIAWLWNVRSMVIGTWRLARFLKNERPDIVVTKGLFPHFYGGLAAHFLDIPCIWHLQDFISERFLKIYQRVFSQVARWLPDYIIVDGASIARQLRHTTTDRVRVIHNGVDTSIFRPDMNGEEVRREVGIPIDSMVIGHVGRMTPWKGQHYLLQAFARIAEEMPNVYLLLVGAPVFDNDSYHRYLVNLTQKLGLSNRVKFAGYRYDMPVVLPSMDVFAFTSTEKDTSPLALLCAMSTALPIVAFDIEGVRELMKEEEQFLTVPVARADCLAESLSRLLSDKKLRHGLSASSRRIAEAEFDLKQHVNRMEEVFLEAVAHRNTIPELTSISSRSLQPTESNS